MRWWKNKSYFSRKIFQGKLFLSYKDLGKGVHNQNHHKTHVWTCLIMINGNYMIFCKKFTVHGSLFNYRKDIIIIPFHTICDNILQTMRPDYTDEHQQANHMRFLAVLWNVILLIHKRLKMHRCIFSIVATDALVLTHQTMCIQSVDWIITILDKLCTEISQL